MSDFNDIVRIATIGAAAIVGMQLIQMATAKTPFAEDVSTKLKRWVPSAQASHFSNGSKQPITDIEQVGPAAYKITHLGNWVTTVHTHDIERYVDQRFYMAKKHDQSKIHPEWTKKLHYH